MSDFQSRTNSTLPLAVEGDFASANPYFNTLVPTNGSFRVGSENGVTVGTFAWADMDTGLVSQSQGSLKIGGFVGRYNQAVVNYRQEASLVIPQGRAITLYRKGDFWVRFSGGASAGQTVVANTTTGVLTAVDTVADGTIDTGYVVATNCNANELAKIMGK